MGHHLSVFDVSPFVYVGEYGYKNYQRVAEGSMPCNGILYLLKNLTADLVLYRDVALCFDSRSFRKDRCESYKSSRKPNNVINAQLDLLFELLPKAGIACFKKDGLEADDLIYNIIEKNKNNFSRKDILGTDYDLTHNIVDSSTEFVSISTNVHSINKETFPYLTVKDRYIEPNTITAYKVFCGDNSDEYKGFVSQDGKITGSFLYNKFCSIFKSKGVTPDDFRQRKLLEYFIEQLKDKFSVADIEKLKVNMDLAFPVEDDSMDYSVKCNIKTVDLKMYSQILRIFNDTVSVKSLNSVIPQSQQIVLSRAPVDTVIQSHVVRMADRLLSGEYAADRSRMIRRPSKNTDMLPCNEF